MIRGPSDTWTRVAKRGKPQAQDCEVENVQSMAWLPLGVPLCMGVLLHLKVWKGFEEVGHISLFEAAISDIC